MARIEVVTTGIYSMDIPEYLYEEYCNGEISKEDIYRKLEEDLMSIPDDEEISEIIIRV